MERLVEKFLLHPCYLSNGAKSLAKKWGVSEEAIKEARQKAREQLGSGKIKAEEKNLSIEERIEQLDIDPKEITSIKYWQNFNGDNRFSINTKPTPFTKDFLKDLLTDIKSYKAPQFTPKKPTKEETNRYCAVINIFDAHLDKLSLRDETDVDFDTTLGWNTMVFENCFDRLLNQVLMYNPEVIYFPVGGDFFNTNGASNATKRGTPQDVNSQFQDAFKAGVKVLRRCIDKAAQYAKVVCPVIAGNHDEDQCFYLGEILGALYEDNRTVEIHNTRHARKYLKFGANLFGFAHGDKECKNINNLPLLMAEEVKHEWAATSHREWFLGDRHHRFEYKFLRNKDFVGVTIRFLRSISSTDAWHHAAGYIGVPKTAEAFVYDYSNGLEHNFTTIIR